jgi:hypothetical protein
MAGKEVRYKTSTLRILVAFPKNYTASERNEIVHDARIIPLSATEAQTTLVSWYTLVGGLSAIETETLLAKLNKIQSISYASPVFEEDNGNRSAPSNVLLVRVADYSDEPELQKLADQNGCTMMGSVGSKIEKKGKSEIRSLEHLFMVKVPKGDFAKTLEITRNLQVTRRFVYVEPNFVRLIKHSSITPSYSSATSMAPTPATAPNDKYYPNQWGLTKINIAGAWTTTNGDASIKVAVIDDGVQFTQPDLVNNLCIDYYTNNIVGFDATYGYDGAGQQNIADTKGCCSMTSPNPRYDFHGTSCAGIIAAQANNTIGIAGIANKCKIVPVRIAFNVRSDVDTTTIYWQSDDLIFTTGINFAWDYAGVDVLSNSWGTSPSSSIQYEIRNAVENGRTGLGCPFLASTGNENTWVRWPASLPNVISVGATTNTDNRCDQTQWGYDANGMRCGSNFGAGTDVTAPGNNLYTTDMIGIDGYNKSTTALGGDYQASFSGTSASCPMAAGVMALILSVNPTLVETDARKILESTCTKVGGYSYVSNSTQPNGTWSNELGYGRIDANAAVAAAAASVATSSGGTGGSGLNVTIVPPTNVCWGPKNPVHMLIHVSGGTPFVYGGVPVYAYEWFDDAGYTVLSKDIDWSVAPRTTYWPSTDITFHSGVPSSFPYTHTYYLKTWDNAGHIYKAPGVTVTINRVADINMGTNVWNTCVGGTYSFSSDPTMSVTNGTQPYTYSWVPSNLVNNPNIYQPIAPNIQNSQNYTLIVTTSVGCSSSGSRYIFVSNPKALIPAGINICNVPLPVGAQPTPYTGSPTAPVYSWSPTTGLDNPNICNPTINPGFLSAGPHTYSLTVTDPYVGCSNTGTMVMNVNYQIPTTSISSTSGVTICPGGTSIITGTAGNGNNGPYQLSWLNGTTVLNSAQIAVGATPVLTTTVIPTTTTTYTFVASNTAGCQIMSPYTITQDPTLGPTVNAGPVSSIMCQGAPSGSSLNGFATGGTGSYTYTWTPGNYTSPIVQINPANSTTFTLTVHDTKGCFSKAQTTVYVDKLGAIWPAAEIKCTGSSFTLGDAANEGYQPLAIGGTPPFVYSWSSPAQLLNPTAEWPTTVPLTSSKNFIVTIIDANGCTVTSPYSGILGVVTVAPPTITTTGSICSGQSFCLNFNNGVTCNDDPQNPVNPGSPSWYQPPAATITYSSTPNATSGKCVTFNSPGNYSVNYTENTGCCPVQSTNFAFTVNPILQEPNIRTACGGSYGGIVAAMEVKLAQDVNTSPCALTISPGYPMTFAEGANGVSIYPGFWAQNGSLFDAFISPCITWNGHEETTPGVLTAVPETDLPKDYLTINPNPTQGILHIEFGISEEQEIKIAVYDMYGKEVINLEEGHVSKNNYELDLRKAGLVNGMYLIKLTTSDKQLIKRVILTN